MEQEVLKQLSAITDDEALSQAVAALCLPFGNIKSIRVLPDGHSKEGRLCYVELDSPIQQEIMMRKLGGISFGGCAVFFIPAAK
jgi:hypothetical protein